jgi:hypothetical protein
MFLDIEAGVDDDFTDSDSEEIGGAFYIFFNILIPNRHHLIDDFIDDVPNILAASGSETQPTVSWNTFEGSEKVAMRRTISTVYLFHFLGVF